LAGFYGFNGTLVGIALLFFFKPTALLFIILIIVVVISTIIMNFMHEKKLSLYTFPFVLTAWIFIFLIKWLNLATPTTAKIVEFTQINILSGISLGFSQVMLQTSIVTGILFFIAILINSRISAIYALIGSVVGFLTGWLFFPLLLNLTNIGILGFNGVLCGIAFADRKWNSLLFALIAIFLSVGITYGFITFGLIALTAPFVFATWITMLARNKPNQKPY
jgi:urea transporter